MVFAFGLASAPAGLIFRLYTPARELPGARQSLLSTNGRLSCRQNTPKNVPPKIAVRVRRIVYGVSENVMTPKKGTNAKENQPGVVKRSV